MNRPKPIRVKELESVESFAKRMSEWIENPSLHPDIDLIQEYGMENVYITDQDVRDAEFEVYHSKYQKAQKLSDSEEALKLYLDILKRHTPLGMSYYLEPIYILEDKGDYQTALSICDEALRVSQFEYVNFSVSQLENIKNRLLEKNDNK